MENNSPLLNELLNRFDLMGLLKILFVVVLSVGILGNLMNLIIFGQRRMRKSIVNRFLFHLSFVDLVILLICSTEAFLSMAFEMDLRASSLVLCKCNTFLAYFLLQLRFVFFCIEKLTY